MNSLKIGPIFFMKNIVLVESWTFCIIIWEIHALSHRSADI